MEEENAAKLIAHLKRKGYNPYVFKKRDFKKRLFHHVRIGDFAVRKEAVQAANEFRQKERKEAVVRPIDEL